MAEGENLLEGKTPRLPPEQSEVQGEFVTEDPAFTVGELPNEVS